MPIQKRTQSLSELTRSLILSGETDNVDFKKTPKSLTLDDLVAFANSGGGQILIGVVETSRNGAQVGEVAGCDVGDGAILEILNKASSCIPPIPLDIFVENLEALPIIRVEISDSEAKPHCTPKGVYCRRDGTRTRPIHPREMLEIFLEIEARLFAAKFEAAAGRITEELTVLEESLGSSIQSMGNQLGWAEFKLGDTESTIDQILGIVTKSYQDSRDMNARIREIFRQDKREDPVREGYKRKLVNQFIETIANDKKLLKAAVRGESLSGTQIGIFAEELTKDEFEEAMHEALRMIQDEVERRKYTSSLRKPADCSGVQIEQFVDLVSMGGEVVAGVRERILRARTLGFVEYSGVPIGVAAIKRPLKSYKQKIFEASNVAGQDSDFLYELGWIYLKENHRGKGLITPLVQQLLDEVGKKPVFATTRSSNLVMRDVLKHLGFESVGKPYRSTRQPDETIQLFVRRP